VLQEQAPVQALPRALEEAGRQAEGLAFTRWQPAW
jgi:hypothetical protein